MKITWTYNFLTLLFYSNSIRSVSDLSKSFVFIYLDQV
jgi:hypothetical protein